MVAPGWNDGGLRLLQSGRGRTIIAATRASEPAFVYVQQQMATDQPGQRPVLKAELEARIAVLGQKGSWPAIIAELDALTETEVEQDGRRFLLRSAPKPAASLALRVAGVALPPTVQAPSN